MKEIVLKDGRVARIDDEDYEKLSFFKWRSAGGSKERRYACRYGSTNGKRKTFYMHREVMGAEKGQEVDHIDGDPLNNQKYNLRFCTHKENMVNRKKNKNSRVPYAGIEYRRTVRGDVTWYARSLIKSPQLYGPYATPEEAARVYDDALVSQRGPFARKNFPATSEPPKFAIELRQNGFTEREVELAVELYKADALRCEAVCIRLSNSGRRAA